MSQKHHVVTGGAGFIGSHVVDTLLERGDAVTIIDNLSTGRRDRVADGATLHVLDIADQGALSACVRALAPVSDWFHMAAQADVRVSVDDPVADATTNVLGTIAVLEAARIHNAPVTFASTGGAIYGDAPLPTPETQIAAPESPYGVAKLAGEAYVQMHARLYGLPHAIVRYANVYGPRQDPHGEAGVVAIFGGKILAGERATIFGDGSQTRDYVYVGDVVATTIAAGDYAAETSSFVGPLNVGTGQETSVLELWNLMCAAAGGSGEFAFAAARPGELQRSALDARTALTLLPGAKMDTELASGLESTLGWMKSMRNAGQPAHL